MPTFSLISLAGREHSAPFRTTEALPNHTGGVREFDAPNVVLVIATGLIVEYLRASLPDYVYARVRRAVGVDARELAAIQIRASGVNTRA